MLFLITVVYFINRDLDNNEIAFIEDGTFAGIIRFGRL